MDDTTWQLIANERRTMADLLEGLTPDQWEVTSLCSEWRVRDVAAHLAMTPTGAPPVATMLRALVTTRGRLWPAVRDVAVAYAAARPEDLVAGLRRDAASRRKSVFVQAENILPDLVIHGQDIAVPLGIDRAVPPAAGRVALSRIWSLGWPFHARRRFAGVTVRAEDCDWSAGQGPEVRGSTAQLLAEMTGRSVGGDLHGPGAEAVRRRTAPAPTVSAT
ncbi:maleylpyruvate isomerase family mycothiol-dependent enzyme [Microlunatus aurantiacus]|uniref:Maleylpyruvate isomerase family mycothiol-dependent enzyme n=1 Tax=Microlunatus aurantiacus TaxID=446786 RepID=A0ABP7DDN9_9ACTN